eukprot:gene39254-biopygen26772
MTYVFYGHSVASYSFVDIDLIDFAPNVNIGFTVTGISSYDQCGYAVSAAGDVNGDGGADIIVGTIAADPFGRTDAGSSYVIFGTPPPTPAPTTQPTLRTPSNVAFQILGEDGAAGYRVSGSGDMNKDGINDYIVAQSQATVLNRVQAGLVIFGANENEMCGSSVSAAGDVNNDGA